MPLFFWLRIILFSLFGLVLVVLPLLILVVAMIEKRCITQFTPIPPDKLKPWTAANQAAIDSRQAPYL